jgi:hypothetical protein
MKGTVEVKVELDATNAKILAAIGEKRGQELKEVVRQAITDYRDSALWLVSAR